MEKFRFKDAVVDSDSLEHFNKVAELHNKVSASPDSALDFGTISKFIISIVIPIVYFVRNIGLPELIGSLFRN